MRIYHLPYSIEFYEDFESDLRKSIEVVIVSPYLSGNVIMYWRSIMSIRAKDVFTIVYDIGNEHEGRRSGLEGPINANIKNQITWRYCERVHTKIYYMKFIDGYALYHGSANFTNYGFGVSRQDKSTRNEELLTRVADENIRLEIDKLIEYYKAQPEGSPVYNHSKNTWEPPAGTIMEYKLILERIGLSNRYYPAKSESILQSDELQKYVKGLFSSKNSRFLKVHTTNNKNKPSFTISESELKWFLGGYIKTNVLRTNRRMLLVIKEQGSWQGNLKIFYVKPLQLFQLLSKSNQTKKIYFNKKSVYFQIKQVDGAYFLCRYSDCVEIEVKEWKEGVKH